MSQIHNTCYKCEEREIGCHATCERYIKAKAEHDEQREKIRKINMSKYEYKEFRYQNVKKTVRNHGKRI